MRYILTAGGTGGHIFPAKAIAEELEKDGHTAIFLTDQRGMPYTQYFQCSRILRLRYISGILGKALLLYDLFFETLSTLKYFKRTKPDLVIGFGGYPSVPGVLAAILLKIPTFVHEQNATLGKANRILANLGVRKIIGSFPTTLNTKKREVVYLGNPVRAEFYNLAPYKSSQNDKFHILIIGGSQGATLFSSVIPKALCLLPKAIQKKIHVTQQCRQNLTKETTEAYQSFQGTFICKPFFEDIYKLYENSNFIIARSGGSTVAEICATGRPALLIPFAKAKEGDQWHNANQLKNHKAAIVCSEYNFTPKYLAALILDFLEHQEKLRELATCAHLMAITNPSVKIKELTYSYLRAS